MCYSSEVIKVVLFLLHDVMVTMCASVLVLGVGYDYDLLYIMKLTIAMMVLMWSIPPAWREGDSVHAKLVLGLVVSIFHAL